MNYQIEAPSEAFGDDTGDAKHAMQALFETIQVAVDYVIRGRAPNDHSPHQNTDVLTAIFTNFVVKADSPHLSVPWMNSVRPVNTTKFRIHIILSMGSFLDEYDLF